MSLPIHPSAEGLLERILDKELPPLVMGIINTTPDSFFPGSRKQGLEGFRQALEYISQGADILDIGGESSRPGSAYVSIEEELDRVIPVIQRIRRESDIPISVDTRKLAVAREAVAAGASCINDISALRDDDQLGPFIAEHDLPVILMHMQGTPENMQKSPRYHDVTEDVIGFLRNRIDYAQSVDIPCERIILDPGIGFGKSFSHNLQLLKHLESITQLGYPVLMGHSRKSFIGRVLSPPRRNPEDELEIRPVEQRMIGSLAVVADSYRKGARIFRVHDVQETADILRVLSAIDRVED